MNKKLITLLLVLLLLLLYYSNFGKIYAAFATSIGTVNNNKGGNLNDYLTTTDLINTSKNYYLGVGYLPSNKITDP